MIVGLIVAVIALATLAGGVAIVVRLVRRAWWKGRVHQYEIDREAIAELHMRPTNIRRALAERAEKTRIGRPEPMPESLQALPEIDLSDLGVAPRVDPPEQVTTADIVIEAMITDEVRKGE